MTRVTQHRKDFYTTLNKIYNCRPCIRGWDQLLQHLRKTQPDDEPLSLATILESNGIKYATWVLQTVDGIEELARLFAVRCVRQHCQHLLTDPRSHALLDVAEMHAVGWVTDEDLRVAGYAARDVLRTAVRDAVWIAVWDATRVAARGEAGDVAQSAACYAAWDAARPVARDAVEVAARIVERKAAWDIIEADYRAIFLN